VKPLKLEFGDLKVGAEKIKHFKISNTQSNSTLTGTVGMPTGAGAAQFTVSGVLDFSLTHGGPADTITVKYTPSAAGATDTASIVVKSSDTNNPTVTVDLTGRGKKK
jgi:hypothetical protein